MEEERVEVKEEWNKVGRGEGGMEEERVKVRGKWNKGGKGEWNGIREEGVREEWNKVGRGEGGMEEDRFPNVLVRFSFQHFSSNQCIDLAVQFSNLEHKALKLD